MMLTNDSNSTKDVYILLDLIDLHYFKGVIIYVK